MKTAEEQIEHNFKYHAADKDKTMSYTMLRNKTKELAYLINDLCPNSRERSLSMTKLEESTMWANAAIARQE